MWETLLLSVTQEVPIAFPFCHRFAGHRLGKEGKLGWETETKTKSKFFHLFCWFLCQGRKGWVAEKPFPGAVFEVRRMYPSLAVPGFQYTVGEDEVVGWVGHGLVRGAARGKHAALVPRLLQHRQVLQRKRGRSDVDASPDQINREQIQRKTSAWKQRQDLCLRFT